MTTMRHVVSDQLADFSAVYDDVELVSVRPSTPAADLLAVQAGEWLKRERHLEAQWAQSAGTSAATTGALSGIDDDEFRARLEGEIDGAVDLLHDLLDCSQVGVRVVTLSDPMCPRFHADLIPCRLLITLAGAGTEWIAGDDVDRERLADRSMHRVPLRTGGRVRTLATGSWSLLKGGRWDDRFSGVIHRSPHGAGRRLLASFDPIF